jgi:hypothetical protein
MAASRQPRAAGPRLRQIEKKKRTVCFDRMGLLTMMKEV